MFGIEQLTAAVKDHANALRVHGIKLDAMNVALTVASLQISKLTKQIERLLGPPSPIQGFTLTLLREDEHMPTFNVYEASIPEATGPNSADVIGGRIKVELDGGATGFNVDTPKGPAAFELKLEQGHTAKVGFVHVDDGGNESANVLYLPEFDVKDGTPPPDAVDGFALVATGEVTE